MTATGNGMILTREQRLKNQRHGITVPRETSGYLLGFAGPHFAFKRQCQDPIVLPPRDCPHKNNRTGMCHYLTPLPTATPNKPENRLLIKVICCWSNVFFNATATTEIYTDRITRFLSSLRKLFICHPWLNYHWIDNHGRRLRNDCWSGLSNNYRIWLVDNGWRCRGVIIVGPVVGIADI